MNIKQEGPHVSLSLIGVTDFDANAEIDNHVEWLSKLFGEIPGMIKNYFGIKLDRLILVIVTFADFATLERRQNLEILKFCLKKKN